MTKDIFHSLVCDTVQPPFSFPREPQVWGETRLVWCFLMYSYIFSLGETIDRTYAVTSWINQQIAFNFSANDRKRIKKKKSSSQNLTVSLSKCQVKTISLFLSCWSAFEEKRINLGSFSNQKMNKYPGYYSKIGLSCDVCQHYLLLSIDGSSLCLFKWQGWDFIFSFTSQRPFKGKVLDFVRVHSVLAQAFFLLQGTAEAINRGAVKVWVQGHWERERGGGE